jgi:hypothetical protein
MYALRAVHWLAFQGLGLGRLVSEKKSTLTFFAGPKPELGLDHLHPH